MDDIFSTIRLMLAAVFLIAVHLNTGEFGLLNQGMFGSDTISVCAQCHTHAQAHAQAHAHTHTFDDMETISPSVSVCVPSVPVYHWEPSRGTRGTILKCASLCNARCDRGHGGDVLGSPDHPEAAGGQGHPKVHLHAGVLRPGRAGHRMVQRQPRHDAERHTSGCIY